MALTPGTKLGLNEIQSPLRAPGWVKVCPVRGALAKVAALFLRVSGDLGERGTDKSRRLTLKETLSQTKAEPDSRTIVERDGEDISLSGLVHRSGLGVDVVDPLLSGRIPAECSIRRGGVR